MCWHKYEDLGTQTASNVMFGIGSPIMRQVKKCKKCDKVKYISLTLGADVNGNYNWQPNVL